MHLILKILLIILAIIAFLIFLLLTKKFRVLISYVKNQGEKLSFEVYLLLFGGKIKLYPSTRKQKKSEHHSRKDKKKENADSPIKKLKSTAQTFADIKNTYKENKAFIRKRLIAEEIYVYIKFGLSDAMKTGIATGIVWGALYQLLAFVCTIGMVKDHKFEVEPVYDKEGFCSSGSIRLSFRAVNVLHVVIRVWRTYKEISAKK